MPELCIAGMLRPTARLSCRFQSGERARAGFLNAYRRVLARRGGDHSIARKLRSYLLAAGIPDPDVTVVRPVRAPNADG